MIASAQVTALGTLENPQPGGQESGIAAITGWHCTSRNIELRIDGVSMGAAGTGTLRADTQAVCGRSDTGFSLLYNYSLLEGGTHKIDAYADGQLFGSATLTVGYLGGEFLTGLAASHQVPDFPAPGQKTRLVWSQSKQNFVISGTDSMTGGALPGTYAIRYFSGVGPGLQVSSLQQGTSISGTIVLRSNGTYLMSFTLIVDGQAVPSSATGVYADFGYYFTTEGEIDMIIERGDTLTFHSESSGASGVLSATRTGPAPAAAAGDAMRDATPALALGIGQAIAAALVAAMR
jgi:hypothetical protein